jgi:KDO2-lipid IV(A) lauroyltransferase
LARRSAFRNRAEAAIARIVLASLRGFPSLGSFYGSLLDRAIPRLRRTALINLRFAYPDRDEAWRQATADGVFRSIGRLLATFAKFPDINRGNVKQWIRYEGFEHYKRAKACGKGVLFATAHLGNWELSAYAHALLAEPMTVVLRPLDNPIIDRIVEARRGASGNHLLSKRDFARSILQALRRNEAVGILVDQNSAPENAAFVTFFGKLASTNLTFAKLAARSGAAVIPGFAVWSDSERRFVLHFYPAVEISGDAAVDTARVQAAVETAIREHPDQWLWIHRRWKTQPEGAPPVY